MTATARSMSHTNSGCCANSWTATTPYRARSSVADGAVLSAERSLAAPPQGAYLSAHAVGLADRAGQGRVGRTPASRRLGARLGRCVGGRRVHRERVPDAVLLEQVL